MWSGTVLKRAVLSYLLISLVSGDDDSSGLEGTWSSKSNQVFTGPGFYNPVDELLIEPSLPGLSYSFTSDGYYEEAAYQVTGNPRDPGCPSAALLFQHGKYEVLSNGTLILTPFEVDGRILISDPCNDEGVSTYQRYNQTETFLSFEVSIDDYHGMYKLQLNQFDGSPLQPLYLAYKPPLMLPTETLNPTATSSGDSSKSEQIANEKRSLRGLIKRNLENRHKTNAVRQNRNFWTSDTIWYISTGIAGLGSVLFLLS